MKYLEVTITYSPDVKFHVIANKVFNRLHGIVKSNDLTVSLSFPKMAAKSVGNIIRIFSDEEQLSVLQHNSGICDLIDKEKITVSSIQNIPDEATEIYYSKHRPVTPASAKNKLIRLIKRGNVYSKEQIDDFMHQHSNRKYVRNSCCFAIERETGNFCLYVKTVKEPVAYNSYGLGGVAYQF